jgi:hypothetical protein
MKTRPRPSRVSAPRGSSSVPTPDFGSDKVSPLPGLERERLGYDSWLLPSVEPDRSERWVRRISIVSGPILLVVAAGLLVWAFLG